MNSDNTNSQSDLALKVSKSISKSVGDHPFVWANIALLAGVPWLLALSMAGLAVGDPVFPTWLEILLLGFPAIALGAWLQWQQPFSPFSLWFIAKSPENLDDNERRVLTLIKQQRNGWYVTGWIAIAIAFVMSGIFCKIYIAAPLAQAIAPFPEGLRLLGVVWAEICFLLSNILLQSGVSALRIKLTADSEIVNLLPFAVDKIKNSFTSIGWRSPQILKFFEEDPEVVSVDIGKREEVKEVSEESKNDPEIADESPDLIEQSSESFVESQSPQESLTLETAQESEGEEFEIVSEVEPSLEEPEDNLSEVLDLGNESEAFSQEAEERVTETETSLQELEDEKPDLVTEPESSFQDSEGLELSNEPELSLQESEDNLEETSEPPTSLQGQESEELNLADEPEDVPKDSEISDLIREPETSSQEPDVIDLDLVSEVEEPDLIIEPETPSQDFELSSLVNEPETSLQESDSEDANLTNEPQDSAHADDEIEIVEQPESVQETEDDLQQNLNIIDSSEETLEVVETQPDSIETLTLEVCDSEEQVTGLATQDIQLDSAELEPKAIAEEITEEIVVENISEAISETTTQSEDVFLESIDSGDAQKAQETSEPATEAKAKNDDKPIDFLKKTRKKGFAQKTFGFGKSSKSTNVDKAPELKETEKTNVEHDVEESSSDAMISEIPLETSNISPNLIDVDTDSPSTADIDDIKVVISKEIQETSPEETTDFDEELDELVAFNVYVENILSQYLAELSEELAEVTLNESVEDEQVEKAELQEPNQEFLQEVEDIIEISSISEQATEIAEEILSFELLQEQEINNQEVEEIIEIAAISEQTAEIVENILIQEDNLENAVPQPIDLPIETEMIDSATDTNVEENASEVKPQYFIQEDLVDQFLAKIEELSSADRANKANAQINAIKSVESAENEELDEFADLEALLNSPPKTDDLKE